MEEPTKATMHYHFVESRTIGKKSDETTVKKYVPRTSHHNTCEYEDYAQQISKSCSIKVSDMDAVLRELGEYLNDHLRQGDVVKIPHIGTFKLEVECKPVEDIHAGEKSVLAKRFQLHVLPESIHGKIPIYENITLKKDKE